MIEKILYDKSKWAEGIWQTEPDYVSWIEPHTHYPCHIRRNEHGAWCGFVGIPTTHPLYLADKNDEVWKFIDVHKEIGFCGLADYAEKDFYPPEKRWWVGFHCGHIGDVLPRIPNNITLNGIYRNKQFVMNQTNYLAQQLFLIQEDTSKLKINI